MEASHYIGIAGLIVGIVGIAYAVYENRTKKKLSNYIRAQNWYLYSKANNASGSVQLASKKYKEIPPDCMNLEVLEWLSKADAFSQDVFKDVIRQIQVSEPVFNYKMIERWVAEGRVAEKHAPLFKILVPAKRLLDRDGVEPRPSA